MPTRLHGTARVALGSLAGAAIAAAIAPLTKRFFSPPQVGVGWVTVNAYPKGWDYAVIALLVFGAFVGGVLGGALLSRPTPSESVERVGPGRKSVWIATAVVFVLMFFLHDHPYAHMDHFHEGEHLTAGWLLKSGEHPYKDFFVFHGLAVDAGLDALSLGDPPSPLRPRRLQTVLDAATIALLVPIAAELTVTTAGMCVAVFASLCAIAALWLPVFPYFRMAPLLIAVLALLRYARNGSPRAFCLAAAAATLGVLWSLDTGTYALAGTAGAFVILRLFRLEAKPLPLARVARIAVIALALPFVLLLLVRADIHRFLVDSFVILPRTIDAIWALPAPSNIDAESLRYYLPPAFYGFLGALTLLAIRRDAGPRSAGVPPAERAGVPPAGGGRRRGRRLFSRRDAGVPQPNVLAARLAIVTLFSLLLFRTAVGRVGWSHTRFALPLLGIALVAFVLEPLMLRRRCLVALLLAVPLFVHLEIAPNSIAGAKLLDGWRARQRHDGMVRYPFATGRGLYTSEQNATDLASLQTFLDSLGPHDAPILDFSNERALYYLLQRKPPVRCAEISMLSVPELLSEAMAQLNANPPVAVVVSGYAEIGTFDGVSNRDRVPELARWIDANYPVKTQVGRFLVATK